MAAANFLYCTGAGCPLIAKCRRYCQEIPAEAYYREGEPLTHGFCNNFLPAAEVIATRINSDQIKRLTHKTSAKMKQLIIKRLALYNFKGIRQAEARFSDTGATISGDNGVGKSTMADAFSWLLFGKNAAGVEQFGIKTVDEAGNFIPHLDHTVEGDFTLIDQETGEVEQIKARRTFAEDWRTGSGETEQKLTGHHTDYFWNDIPVKKSEYDAHVAETIPADIFNVITDAYAFLALPWDVQRNKLTQITGEVSPADIAANNPDYAALLRRAKGATLEQYCTSLGAQRKRIAAELDAIPTRKDELQRATPITPDYAVLEARKAELERTIADLDAAAGSLAERNRLQYQQAAEIQKQIGEQEKLQQAAIHAADLARNQANHEAQKRHNDLEAQIRQLKLQVKGAQEAIDYAANYQRQAASYTEQAAKKDAELADFRKRYEAFFNQTYTPGSLICPRFGHQCTDPTACAKGEQDFNASQVETLTRWREQGHQMADELERLKAKAAEMAKTYTDQCQQANQNLAAYRAQLDAKQAELAALPAANLLPEINPADLPEWKAAADKIAELRQQYQAALQPSTGETAPATHPDAKRHAQMELDEVKRKLGLRTIIEANERRQQELDRQAATLAQEKADIEKELSLADSFTIAIMDAVEQRVNAHFGLVQFKMFKTLVNGSKQPACIATVNGVAYKDVNTAGQINAGLDVIQTLTRFYQFAAPIFVDNCESVAELKTPAGAQVIRLQFVKGQPLTITPE